MKEIYIKSIAERVGVKEWQVENCAKLFEEGATIPFISRYRKERTGGLDEVAIAEIRHWTDVFIEMDKRKATIVETISQAGALTDGLRLQIENSVDNRELEDLYLPYKPKRRTRATVAKEAGLEPLADRMYEVSLADPYAEARKYVGNKVASVDEALAGARDIIAERLSETASVRDTLRQIFRTRRLVAKATRKAVGPEAMKYKAYFDFSESLERIAPVKRPPSPPPIITALFSIYKMSDSFICLYIVSAETSSLHVTIVPTMTPSIPCEFTF